VSAAKASPGSSTVTTSTDPRSFRNIPAPFCRSGQA
jgi:hypothetical protein